MMLFSSNNLSLSSSIMTITHPLENSEYLVAKKDSLTSTFDCDTTGYDEEDARSETGSCNTPEYILSDSRHSPQELDRSCDDVTVVTDPPYLIAETNKGTEIRDIQEMTNYTVKTTNADQPQITRCDSNLSGLSVWSFSEL